MGREIRKVFIPEEKGDMILSCDYSQIELRVLAHIANDKNMIDSFKHHSDIHTKTASEVFNVDIDSVTKLMRSRAKAVNFGILDYCVFCISSFLVIIFITGPIADLSSVFMFGIDNVKSLFVMLAGGFVFNLALALSTVVTILFFSKPFLSALNRVIFRLNVNSLFHSQF